MPPTDGTRLAMTEHQFQMGLVAAIRLHGFKVHFVPDNLYRRSFPSKSQKEQGLKPRPIDLGDRGFPDLTIAGPKGVAYRELKVGRNQLTPDQEEWRDILLAGGADWAEWRDRDYDDILYWLQRGLIRG